MNIILDARSLLNPNDAWRVKNMVRPYLQAEGGVGIEARLVMDEALSYD